MGSFRLQSLEEQIEYEKAYAEYATFLVKEWTPALRNLGMIPPDDTINIFNYSNVRNAELLMKMSRVNYMTYDTMATKFIQLHGRITICGGTF